LARILKPGGAFAFFVSHNRAGFDHATVAPCLLLLTPVFGRWTGLWRVLHAQPPENLGAYYPLLFPNSRYVRALIQPHCNSGAHPSLSLLTHLRPQVATGSNRAAPPSKPSSPRSRSPRTRPSNPLLSTANSLPATASPRPPSSPPRPARPRSRHRTRPCCSARRGTWTSLRRTCVPVAPRSATTRNMAGMSLEK